MLKYQTKKLSSSHRTKGDHISRQQGVFLQLRHYGLLTLIAVSIITSLPLFSTSTASAVTNLATPDDEAKSLSYYSTLGGCIEHNMSGDIHIQGSDNGNATPASWFDGNEAWGVVYPDGKLDCKDIAPKALALWGWGGDNQGFLRDIGYTYDAGKTTWSGPADKSNGQTRRIRFESAVQSKVYGVNFTGEPPISDAAWYNIYLQNFQGSVCKAKDLGTYPTDNATYNDWALNSHVENGQDSQIGLGGATSGSIKYGRVDIAEASGTNNEFVTKTHAYAWYSATTYSGEVTSSADARATLYGYHTSQNSQTCDQLHDNVSKTAPGWVVWKRKHPGSTATPIAPATAKTTDSSNDKKTSCTIDGIGWIVCPVMNFMGGIVDGAYGVIAVMLTTSPSMFDTSKPEGQATLSAWSVMRNFANVAFVIVFLIIIFSQLTSAGISNYGIKKMLPKLIVAAILVNVSYYLCAIAVDISNILGGSLKGIMDNISGAVNITYGSDGWHDAVSGNGKNVFTGLIGGLIATAGVTIAILYAGLSVLLPILIAALAAVVTVVVVLTMRQALIVLLIVISPLAFVALLLPNTEGLFKKWRSLLTTLLLMYPIIALIFGASALAGKIVMGSSSNMLVQIMGAGVTIIPLFITPIVMKTAGGLLSRFAGVVNNPSKGPFDRMRKGAEGIRKDRQNVRNMRALDPNGTGRGQFGRGAVVRWSARRKAIQSGRESEMNRANTEYIAKQSETNMAFQNAAAGGTILNSASASATQRALANAINVQAKLETDEVNAATAVIQHANLSDTDQQALAKNGSVVAANGQTYSGAAMQIAAIQRQAQTTTKNINELLDEAATGTMGEPQRKAFAQALSSSSSRPAYVGQMALENIRQNTSANAAALAQSGLNTEAYSAEKIASADKDELQYIAHIAATDPGVRARAKVVLRTNANEAMTNPELKTKLGKSKNMVLNVRNGSDPGAL